MSVFDGKSESGPNQEPGARYLESDGQGGLRVTEGNPPGPFGPESHPAQPAQSLDEAIAAETQRQMGAQGFEDAMGYADVPYGQHEQGEFEDEVDPADVAAAAVPTPEQQQALEQVFEDTPGLAACHQEMMTAVSALEAEYGPHYINQIVSSPEGILAVYEAIGGDARWGDKGAELRIKQGILGSPGGGVFD